MRVAVQGEDGAKLLDKMLLLDPRQRPSARKVPLAPPRGCTRNNGGFIITKRDLKKNTAKQKQKLCCAVLCCAVLCCAGAAGALLWRGATAGLRRTDGGRGSGVDFKKTLIFFTQQLRSFLSSPTSPSPLSPPWA